MKSAGSLRLAIHHVALHEADAQARLGLFWPSPSNELQAMVGAGTIDLIMGVVLLAGLAVLSLSGAAFFWPRSSLLRGLALLATSAGLLATLNVFFTSAINVGVTLENLPRLFELSSPPGFPLEIALLPPLGFLISGWGMTLGARVEDLPTTGSAHRDPVSASASTEPSGHETLVHRKRGEWEPRAWQRASTQNPWRIGRRQMIAMIAGVLIYGLMSNLFIKWEAPGETNFQIISAEVVLAVYLGIAYGPWVGLVAGGIGSMLITTLGNLTHLPFWILSNYAWLNSLPLTLPRPPITWLFLITNVLTGFLAGLPLLKIPRREMSVPFVLTVTIRSAFAILVSLALTTVLSEHSESAFLLALQSNLTYETLPTLLVVVLLMPLLLVLLPGRARGENKAQAFARGSLSEPEGR